MYSLVFDVKNGHAPSEDVVDFVSDNIHRLTPFEDDWYGNDEMDINGLTLDGKNFFVVYAVENGCTDIHTVLASGKIEGAK